MSANEIKAEPVTPDVKPAGDSPGREQPPPLQGEKMKGGGRGGGGVGGRGGRGGFGQGRGGVFGGGFGGGPFGGGGFGGGGFRSDNGGRGGARGGYRGGFNRGVGDDCEQHGGRGGSRGGSRGGGGGQGSGVRFDRTLERLQAIQGQATLDLESLDYEEKKFNGRARLYIGNIANDTTEEELKDILSEYGEVGEIFFNREKMFAFIRMATRAQAEKAKCQLDGQTIKFRVLKVRFAPHQGAIKISNLGPWVSNELLHRAFSIFGDIERCLVSVDDRGRSKGEGIVEFDRKPSALEAVKRCAQGCFFLTASLRPVICELLESNDNGDEGMQEKMLPKRNADYHYERETGPRFAQPGSFEHEYGCKWKAVYELKKQKLEALDREMKLEEDKLVAQMQYARYEHETEHLREQLRQREASKDFQKSQWEMKEREMENMIKQEQERCQREEQNMMMRMQQQDINMRQKQQDNSLFMQAQELNNMLDQQEAAVQASGNPGFGGGNMGRAGHNGGFGEPFQNEGDFGGFGFGGNQWNDNDGPGGKRRRF